MIEFRSFTGSLPDKRLCAKLRKVGSFRCSGWCLRLAHQKGIDLKLLLLTHGHIDHIRTLRIKRRFNCPIGFIPGRADDLGSRLLSRLRLPTRGQAVQPDLLIEATPSRISRDEFQYSSARALSGEPLFLLPRKRTAHRRRRSLRWRGRPLGPAGRRWRPALRRHPRKALSTRRQRHCPARPRPADDDRGRTSDKSIRGLTAQVME